jgi:hypothetical protein
MSNQSPDAFENPRITDAERQQIVDQVGIATATMYPSWQPGEPAELTADKVRGDLALTTVNLAREQGYKVVVVDGGSSSEFVQALQATGAIVETQTEKGMSAGRRQAFQSVSQLDNVSVVCWTEPEKVSMIRDCLAETAKAVLDDQADIAVPSRDEAAFATYPDYQAEFEQESNRDWNRILQRHDILPASAEPIDAWIGPRVFKNEPDVLKLFMERYQFAGEQQSGLGKDHPDLWSNAIFLPIIAALAKRYRVKSIPVPYRHPAEQTAIERDSPEFRAKRALQQKSIMTASIHFIRLLEGNPDSRLTK